MNHTLVVDQVILLILKYPALLLQVNLPQKHPKKHQVHLVLQILIQVAVKTHLKKVVLHLQINLKLAKQIHLSLQYLNQVLSAIVIKQVIVNSQDITCILQVVQVLLVEVEAEVVDNNLFMEVLEQKEHLHQCLQILEKHLFQIQEEMDQEMEVQKMKNHYQNMLQLDLSFKVPIRLVI